MRAITGTVLSSKPCSLDRAVSTLTSFIDSAASHLPSSDAATYLSTATDAANNHLNFRRRLQHQGDTFEGDQKHVKLQPSGDQAGERILEEKNSPASDMRRKKKEKAKHVEEEDEKENVQHRDMLKAPDGGLQASQPVEEIDKKKKKEKKHNKQEGEVRGAKEVDKIIVSYGATEQETANKDKENKRKKNKQHAEEEEVNKGRNVNGGDLRSDKKRKSKRTRGDSNDGDIELGEHTKKKSRKQTGN